MRVLIVEDDKDLNQMYKLALAKAGHSVSTAFSAQTALDKLESSSFEAVVLDILLPHHNGLSVLHELRSYEDWQAIPVVVLSNLNPLDIGLKPGRFAQLGIKNFLVKSRHKPGDLVAAVEALPA